MFFYLFKKLIFVRKKHGRVTLTHPLAEQVYKSESNIDIASMSIPLKQCHLNVNSSMSLR